MSSWMDSKIEFNDSWSLISWSTLVQSGWVASSYLSVSLWRQIVLFHMTYISLSVEIEQWLVYDLNAQYIVLCQMRIPIRNNKNSRNCNCKGFSPCTLHQLPPQWLCPQSIPRHHTLPAILKKYIACHFERWCKIYCLSLRRLMNSMSYHAENYTVKIHLQQI